MLACLAVIIVPIMLDGEGLGSPDFSVSVPAQPPQPQTPEIPQSSENMVRTVNGPLPGQDRSDSEDAFPATDSVTEPGTGPEQTQQDKTQEQGNLNQEGLPRGWSIRLGAFSDAANAAALQTRLRDQGHRAYTRILSSANGQLTAVYVGPVLTRTEAGQLRDALETDFDLEGQVVEFSIDE